MNESERERSNEFIFLLVSNSSSSNTPDEEILLKRLPSYRKVPKNKNKMIRFLVLALTLLASQTNAWSATISSSFGGRTMSSTVQNGATMVMKKGKANVPPQMRSQYKRAQEMAQMKKQMIDASQPGADGLPVFNLFVRTKRQNVSTIIVF